jgi:hypothetical protein
MKWIGPRRRRPEVVLERWLDAVEPGAVLTTSPISSAARCCRPPIQRATRIAPTATSASWLGRCSTATLQGLVPGDRAPVQRGVTEQDVDERGRPSGEPDLRPFHSDELLRDVAEVLARPDDERERHRRRELDAASGVGRTVEARPWDTQRF